MTSEVYVLVICLPQPGAMVGAYRIIEKLGRGGSGHVYKAERGGRFYAIKVLDTLEEGGWSRRELAAMLRLSLDNVVRFKSFDRWPDAEVGYPCIVMEFVPGPSLEDWARRLNPSVRAVLTVFHKAVMALEDIFELGVLHRDIKASNILIREHDGEPVLIDFGFSAVRGDPMRTVPGMLPPGTPEYRSPEAVRFVRGESRALTYTYGLSDELWAAGVLLYWLLTDTLPFGSRNTPGLNDRIRLETPLAPHVLNPRVPEAVGRLCLRMLEKEPRARFQTHEALLVALEELLAGSEGEVSWDQPLLDPEPPRLEGEGGSDLEGDESGFPGRAPRRRRGQGTWEERSGPGVAPAGEQRVPGGKKTPPWTWGWMLLGLVLAVCAVALWHRASSPPVTSTQGRETEQAMFVHEMARAGEPSQAQPDAAPDRAQPPASSQTPMSHSADVNQTPSRQSTPPRGEVGRSCWKTVALGALAGAVLEGCTGATAPQVRPSPPPVIECPAGWKETHELFGLRRMDIEVVQVGTDGEMGMTAEVKEGPVTVMLGERWARMPRGTVFTGTFKFGENRFGEFRIFGRFDHAQTQEGRRYPICVQALLYGPADYCERPGIGLCPADGSTPPGHVRLWQRFTVGTTKNFGEE
ncbi:protein kinase [Cystobacter fuscus DSM 2262]|uniref:non-specific serine/threonine protein kinase n=1 Tax=Cystobacter fuscus (strain ATCC 25194 / DSM 2262 / NBRC 100088 / M29) TaxID=1242864 RepID=S9Q6Q1_CYSF2|nr:serine/threonine-protein kinase [Cystobacter fuscus]EPX57004.1 protein kinase [Cystobacter fuscus DSM 2262]